jgi:DNA-binding LacI/PurR family transcriptional regulator
MGESPAFLGFQRASVAQQAAAVLREAVRARTWIGLLPSEQELARRFGIGRSTVRVALAQLAAEGLIVIRNGRRARVLLRRRSKSAPPAPTVCLIVPNSPETLLNERPLLSEIHAQLAEKRIGWEEIIDSSLSGRNLDRRVRRLAAHRQGVCWLLMRSSAALQRWFADSRLPALVLGTSYPGVKLPSIDMNYRALGRHAAGNMIRKGHRHVAFIMPEPAYAGDLAGYDEFADYLARNKSSASAIKVTAAISHSAFLFKLDRMLGRDPRPTAILSILQRDTLTVLLHLLRSKLEIPRDISLVSGDTDILFELAIPELARYYVPAAKMARGVVRVAHRLLIGLPVLQKPSLIVPSYVAGSTLGTPPQGARR